MKTGGVLFDVLISAFIFISGFEILSIGLLLSDSSPKRTDDIFWADRIPIINLIEVPELPKLNSVSWPDTRARLFPWINSDPSRFSIWTPIDLQAAIVALTSSEFR